MENIKQKEELIARGKHLLTFVLKKDFGWGIIGDVMDDGQLKELNAWFDDVYDYVQEHSSQSQIERLNSLSWIINGERVSVERIRSIISLIDEIQIN